MSRKYKKFLAKEIFHAGSGLGFVARGEVPKGGPIPPGGNDNEPMAYLLDKLSQFDEDQLKIMGRFADFIIETESDDINRRRKE